MKNPYANIPTSIWLVATATFISCSGMMVLFFLPLYLTQKLNFNIITAGQIVSLYGIGQVIGSNVGGLLSDRFGFLKVQVTGFFMVGLLYLSLEFVQLKFNLMAIMFFVGIFNAAVRPATGSMIAKFSSPDTRAKAYSLNYQALNLGVTIGPAIGGMLAKINYMWLFRIDGMANILAAVAIWFFFHKRIRNISLHGEPKQVNAIKTSPWKDKSFLILLTLFLLIGMCFFQIFNIYPFYLKSNYHLTEIQIGLVMALNGLLIILLQMPITAYFRNFNLLRIISIGGVLISAGYFILPWHSGFFYALLSITLISLGEMATMPFAYDFVTKIAPVNSRGNYLGLLACALSAVPLFLTPNLMPYIYTTFGPHTLWYSMGLIGIIIFIGFELMNKSYAANAQSK